jgi:hypothetical protein
MYCLTLVLDAYYAVGGSNAKGTNVRVGRECKDEKMQRGDPMMLLRVIVPAS